MLKACPNKKIPKRTMNITGSTAATSAISAARVSPASLRKILNAKVIAELMSGNSPCVSRAIKHHGDGECHAIGDHQGIGIVERDVRSRQPERNQRKQDVADILQSLT